jgi:putative flippase GtrA
MRKILRRIHQSKSQRATFARFTTVAVTISVVDICCLYLLVLTGANPYLGRIASLGLAMAVGYILNRYFTFHHLETGRALWHSLMRHYSAYAFGSGVNIATFYLVLEFGSLLSIPLPQPVQLLIGIWSGGMAGLCCNFFLTKKLVFNN